MRRRQQRSNRNVLSSRDPLGAGVAYSNSGFQDYGGIISDSLKQTGAAIDKSLQNRLAQEKFEEEKAGLMVEGFMANMSDDMDLTAIPEEDKGIITEFSMNQKQIFADAAEAASTMKAGSPEKIEQIAVMKKANQRLKNVDSQYKTWGGMRQDYVQDFQNKNLSEANNSGTMIQSAGIFTGAQQRSFDEDGNIMFTDPSGNVTRMSDIKQPFEKAWKQGDKINEIMMGLYSDGAELDDATTPYLRNKLDRLIDNSGVEGLQSLAFDKMVGGESFFSAEEKAMLDALDTSDPGSLIEAKKAIKEKLLDRMMDVAGDRATAGYNKKQSAISESKNKDIKDFSSMVISDSPTDVVEYYTDDKGRRTASSVNTKHSLNQKRMSFYNEAALSSNPAFKITNINAKEDVDGNYNPGDASDGVYVTDRSGSTIGGPYYNEEDLTGFLNRQQLQK